MGEGLFFILLGSIIWIGWPLWQIAQDIRALRDKAGA